jgi:ribosomal protein S27E
MNQNQNEKHHSVRRIVLPSGRSIEVVRFDEEVEAHATTGIHICPSCGSELVQPVDWGESSDDRWELTLHCPNCDWTTQGVYDHEQVMALEEELDEGISAILRDLKRLSNANIADEIDRFVAALAVDLILPEDF